MSRAKPSDDVEIRGEVMVCPLTGCDRVVVGDETAMRNHVANSEDELHEDMVLDADGEPFNIWAW